MNKLSLVAALLTVLCATSGYAQNVNVKQQGIILSPAESASIKAIVEEIAAAAQSGDEQLVAKLLVSAIKSNPNIADKIVASFVSSQTLISSSTTSQGNSVNISAIINSVVTNLQNQKGSEGLVAAVLSSYTPAAGSDKQESKTKEATKLPPSLPDTGKVGGDDSGTKKLGIENPGQTSGH